MFIIIILNVCGGASCQVPLMSSGVVLAWRPCAGFEQPVFLPFWSPAELLSWWPGTQAVLRPAPRGASTSTCPHVLSIHLVIAVLCGSTPNLQDQLKSSTDVRRLSEFAVSRVTFTIPIRAVFSVHCKTLCCSSYTYLWQLFHTTLQAVNLFCVMVMPCHLPEDDWLYLITSMGSMYPPWITGVWFGGFQLCLVPWASLVFCVLESTETSGYSEEVWGIFQNKKLPTKENKQKVVGER